ncbi:2-succinyl-6-hydroxy-2, 4-cyclohexadiene-1-carboxylate synthase, partial [Haemophilus influenzae]
RRKAGSFSAGFCLVATFYTTIARKCVK